jgi:hypothetical protein
MATIKAELQRKDALNNLVAWMLVNDAANSSTGRSDPVIDFGARQTLASILAELQDTLTVDGTVDIDAGTVALLRDVQAAVTGEVALDAATIADLKTIVATVSGTVDVGNFPVLGVISDGNSTDTPLGSGASFVGTGIEVLDFVSCEVTVFANVASANQGLRLETSPDGTNWSHYHTYTVPANANRCYQFTLSARYFRVVYVNGGTAQTTFRLQTRLSRAAAAPHYHELDHPVDGTHPAQMVRAVLTGQQTGGAGSGDYINVRVNPQGRLAAEVQAQTLGDPVGPTAFTQGLEDPDGDLAVPLLDAARRQLVTDQHDQALTDAQLRATSVPVAPDPSSVEAAFAAGMLYAAGARFGLSSAQRGVWQLLNPVGSGFNLYLVSFTLFANESSRIRFNRLDTALTGDPIDPFPLNQISPDSPVAEFRAVNNGTSDPDGTVLPIEARVSLHDHYEFDGMIGIPPGHGYLMWVQAPVLGIGDTADVAGAATWFGVPI